MNCKADSTHPTDMKAVLILKITLKQQQHPKDYILLDYVVLLTFQVPTLKS